MGVTDEEGYLRVNRNLRVVGQERIYAAGDCAGFLGPKMCHMAVREGEVVATNIAVEIEGREPTPLCLNDILFVIDEIGARNGIYFHKEIGGNERATVRQGRFWSWAKQIQKEYWEAKHF